MKTDDCLSSVLWDTAEIMAGKPDRRVKAVWCRKNLDSLASKQNSYPYGFPRLFLQLPRNSTVTILSLVCIELDSPYAKTIYPYYLYYAIYSKCIYTHGEQYHWLYSEMVRTIRYWKSNNDPHCRGPQEIKRSRNRLCWGFPIENIYWTNEI